MLRFYDQFPRLAGFFFIVIGLLTVVKSVSAYLAPSNTMGLDALSQWVAIGGFVVGIALILIGVRRIASVV